MGTPNKCSLALAHFVFLSLLAFSHEVHLGVEYFIQRINGGLSYNSNGFNARVAFTADMTSHGTFCRVQQVKESMAETLAPCEIKLYQ